MPLCKQASAKCARRYAVHKQGLFPRSDWMYFAAARQSSAPCEIGALLSRSLVERPYPSISAHQTSKPRRANQSMPEESIRPGTSRSNTGRAAIEEPWTNRIVPAVCGLSATRLFQSASLTSAPLFAQCSSPVTGAAVSTKVISFDPVIVSIAFRRVEPAVVTL